MPRNDYLSCGACDETRAERMLAYLDSFDSDVPDLEGKRAVIKRQIDHYQSSEYRESLAGTIGRDPALATS